MESSGSRASVDFRSLGVGSRSLSSVGSVWIMH